MSNYIGLFNLDESGSAGTLKFSNGDVNLDLQNAPTAAGELLQSTSTGAAGWASSAAFGDVTGPASVLLDDTIATYNGTTGKIIKDSGVKLTRPGTNDLMINATLTGVYAGTENTIISNTNLNFPCTSGSSNVFIASDPTNLTTGARNLAIGNLALSAVDADADNVGLGDRAGQNCNGIRNVFIGSSAGVDITTNHNTIVGSIAGNAATTASGLTCLGYAAGTTTVITGANNTLLGNSTNLSSATFTNSTAVGAGAIIGASNQCMIGNSSLGSIESGGATCDLGSITNTFEDLYLRGNAKFYNNAKSFSVNLYAETALAANVSYQLPSADGTTGQVLQTNGSGVMSWVDQSGGGGSGGLFRFLTGTSGVFSSLGDATYLSTLVGATYAIAYDGVSRWIIGTGGGIYYSDDQLNTTTIVTGSVGVGYPADADYDATNGDWVVTVGTSGAMRYSSNGTTFSTPTSPFNTNAYSVCNNNNGTWIACGATTNTLARSIDGGATWTGLGTAVISSVGLACKFGNGIFVVGGIDSSNIISTSADGITWTSTYVSVHTTSTRCLCYSPELNIWVSGGIGTFYFGWNADPTAAGNWTGATVSGFTSSGANSFPNDIGWDGEKFIANTYTSGDMFYSYDGKIWTRAIYSATNISITPNASTHRVGIKKHPRT